MPQYQLLSAEGCVFFSRGDADVYQIRTAGPTYYLKIYRPPDPVEKAEAIDGGAAEMFDSPDLLCFVERLAHEEDYAQLQELQRRLTERLRELPDASQDGDIGWCHGDLGLCNIRCREDGSVVFFDFGDAGFIPRATELVRIQGFKDHWPNAWPDMDAALEEVQESLEAGRINRIAIDDNGTVLGWLGATSQYNGNAWELHPLVVVLEHQGKGIGCALVADLEVRISKQGGITIYLGTDDEDGMTSLGNTDLYPHVVEHIVNILLPQIRQTNVGFGTHGGAKQA